MSARPISIETATGQEHVLQALNHERSILGTWMAAPATIDEVSTLLGDEDFTIEKHRRIRRQIITLHERGEAVTAHAVAQALLEAGKLLDGELGYITGLAAPSGDYVLPQGAGIITSYARTLRSLTMRRLVIRETDRLRSEALTAATAKKSAPHFSEPRNC